MNTALALVALVFVPNPPPALVANGFHSALERFQPDRHADEFGSSALNLLSSDERCSRPIWVPCPQAFPPLEATRRAMRELRPGMDRDQVIWLLQTRQLNLTTIYGSPSFGFSERYELTDDYSLTIHFSAPEGDQRVLPRQELLGAMLCRGDTVIERAWELTLQEKRWQFEVAP